MKIKNHTAYVVYYHTEDAPADPFKLKVKFVPQQAEGDTTTVKSDNSGEGNKDAATDDGGSDSDSDSAKKEVDDGSGATNNFYNYNEKIKLLVFLGIMNTLMLK